MSEARPKPPSCNTGVTNPQTKKSEWRIDWIAGTFSGEIPGNHILGENTKSINGLSGYTEGIEYSTGAKSYTNPSRPDMGTYVVLSGGALATIALLDVQILRYFLAHNFRFSRLDIAIDAWGYGFSLEQFESEIDKFSKSDRKEKTVVTRAQNISVWSNKTTPGATVYIGRKSSTFMLRIYDKGAQIEQGETDHWRFEVVIKKPQATQAAQNLLSAAVRPEQIIKGVCDFPELPNYQELMDGEAVRMKAPKPESKTKRWLMTQVAASMATVLFEDGDQSFLFDWINQVRELHDNL